MFSPLKLNLPAPNSLGRSLGWVLGLTLLATPALAHQVRVSAEVGGTLHLEPNDTPRAGTASQVWIALIRRGGQPVPLSACNCQLAVYSQPRRQNAAPLQQPGLRAIAIEGRQDIPATTLTFPRPGSYELVLRGRPVTSGAFAPFELRFPVTVAQ